MSKNSQSLNHNTNTKEIILGIAVASLVGVITWKMFLKKFFGGSKEEGPKYASTLIDRDTKVSLKLIKKTEVSHDTRLFRFELPSPQHVLGLPVGKHISLVADIDGKKVIRSYTPVSSDKNDQGYVDLIIKVYFPNVHPKFPEGGKMTMYLENMKIGDSIDFVGPKGFIEYQSTGSLWIQQDKKVTSKAERVYVRKIGMIAGGSGITPMLQIMRHIASNQPEDNTEVSLLFANQTEKDILCREEIEDLVAKSNGKFKVHYTLDKAPENWKYSTGFINQEMLEMTMPAYGIPTPGATPQILICGPPPMIKFACMPALEKMGWENNTTLTLETKILKMGNFQTCGPNELMVVSGMCTGSRPKTIAGGRTFVLSFGLQRSDKLSLNTQSLTITSNAVNSQLAVNAVGVAQIKINTTDHKTLDTATQLFLGTGNNANVVANVAIETLEGHQRAIIGNMTVEEMFRDKQKFSDEVKTTASAGLQIVSYTLKSLTDNNGYLHALGKPEIAEVHARQTISEALNLRDSDIKQAEADELVKGAGFASELEITKANMSYELQKADNQKTMGRERATADLAGRLQDAITQQEVVEQKMQVQITERQKEIQVQEEEIKRREQELIGKVIKPAEADTYKILKDAEATRNKIILQAEAEAKMISLKGHAEAEAIQAQAEAEAERLRLKAEAFAQYREAALVDIVLDVMPKIAAEIAAPLNNANKISMVSSGDGEIGASRVAKEVLGIMESLPDVVQNLTGVDISRDLKSITGH